MTSRHWFSLAILAVLTPALTASAQEDAISPGGLERLGYYEYWQMQVEFERGDVVKRGDLVDDNLYLITDDGDVHAIHAGVGLPRWHLDLTEAVYTVFDPTHFVTQAGRHLAVLTSSTRVVIVDRYSGELVADMPMTISMAGPVIADGPSIYFGSNDGQFYSMLWADARKHRVVERWRVMIGGPATGTPVLVADGTDLIFASAGGSVFNCTAGQRILNWEFPTGGPILADIQVDDGSVYVASTDRSLYRVDAVSGVERWRVRFPDPLEDGPVVVRDTVYQFCRSEGVSAIDAITGKLLWKHADARQFICQSADQVLLTGHGHVLYKVDLKSGKTVAAVELSRRAIAIPNKIDDALFLVTPLGKVLCGRPLGRPHLTPEEVASASRWLHHPPATHELGAPPDRPIEGTGLQGIIDPDDPLKSPSKVSPLDRGNADADKH